MYQTYRDRAAFFIVYIAEAHTTDGWQVPANLEQDFCIRQPATFEERCAAARLVEARLGMTIPTLVDSMDDAASEAFSAWPERIYVIDRDGRIAYPGAPGPGGFNPAEAEAVVRRLLGEAGPPFDPTTLKPFTAGERYLGEYETGLYPGGTNEIPPEHRRAGERLAATIRPLDVDGNPDDASGRTLALALGHSNCRMYFGALRRFFGTPHPAPDQHVPRPGYLAQFDQSWQETARILARRNLPPPRLHPRFALLNAAAGGQQLPQLLQAEGPVWERAAALTGQPGYSPQQVQVLFFHTTVHGASNRYGAPPGEFPESMRRMQAGMARVLQRCVQLYPNLKIAYLTADGFRHFTGFEPHVWREAFGIKWLIESQIEAEPGTEYEGESRRLPWLQWGPYIWDNTWDQSYFTDGVHPAAKALAFFIERYWRFLQEDPVARPWLLAP